MEKIICPGCGASNLNNSKYCSRCGYELPKVKEELLTETVHLPNKNKLTGKAVIGIVVGIVAMFAVQQIFFKSAPYDKAMMEIASELNKSCPIMIDAETRLDNTIALPENTFQYNYTLVNIDQASPDTSSMKSMLEPIITNYVRTNPQMKYQRDHKTTIVYSYRSNSGQYLFGITITPDKYE